MKGIGSSPERQGEVWIRIWAQTVVWWKRNALEKSRQGGGGGYSETQDLKSPRDGR